MDDVRRPDRPGDDAPTRPLRRVPPGREMSPEAKRWQDANRDAMEDFNRWDEAHGSPLDKHRRA